MAAPDPPAAPRRPDGRRARRGRRRAGRRRDPRHDALGGRADRVRPVPGAGRQRLGRLQRPVDRPEHPARAPTAATSLRVGLRRALADDDDTVTNIFVRDRTTGTTTLVSRASGARGCAVERLLVRPPRSATTGATSRSAAAPTTSRRTTPTRTATSSCATGRTHTTILISETTGVFATTSNGSSTEPVISGDGSAVAFTTTATNLDGLLGPTATRTRTSTGARSTAR